MSQIDIFPPASRKTDPATSHKAEAQFTESGARGVRMNQVLDLVRKYPGSTTGELARFMLREHPELPVRTAVESPHKRVNDLRRKGLVFKGVPRECTDTWRVCETWYAVEKNSPQP